MLVRIPVASGTPLPGVSRGILRFGLATAVMAAGASVSAAPDSLAKRDEAYKHGTVEYRFKGPSGDSDPKAPKLDYRGKLTFASNGTMMERLEKPQYLGADVKYAAFVQGKGWRYTEMEDKNGIAVVFDDNGGWFRNDDVRTMIQDIPCGPLGLGLGIAKSVQESKDGANAVYSGAINDGLTFRLAIQTDGTPVRLEYINGEKLFGKWEYSGSIAASPSLRLPKKAEFRAPWLGAKGDRDYEFLSADLRAEPDAKDLVTKWFRPGVEIKDHRVDPPVAWSYDGLLRANGGSTELTPLQLLELSKGRSDGAAKAAAEHQTQLAQANRASDIKFFLLVGVFGAFVFGTVGYWELRRKARVLT